jgi:uncharacterized protein YcbX
MSDTSREIGRVAGLWRYPVKSMAAEPLEQVEVSWHGLAGDRRWAFVRGGLAGSGFPWLTIRERPDLTHHAASFAQPGDPDGSPTMVRTPSGEELDVTDPGLAAMLGDGVRVMKQHRGIFDTLPLSLITTRTVDAVGAAVGDDLDVLRFRPNLLVAPSGGEPFQEDGWIGHTLRLGDLRMRVDRRDRRCVMVDIDPATLERGPGVLRAIARERESCLGVYGSTVTPGRVAIGDPVLLDG